MQDPAARAPGEESRHHGGGGSPADAPFRHTLGDDALQMQPRWHRLGRDRGETGPQGLALRHIGRDPVGEF